ncbi:sigma-70 family RNA polymerase sigma factor [Pseudaminobacter sp. NGMCC 1.201702]|uniref:sigma-70 family RNA polymerase sigma factor n=1 Tax=Pseudaminobacter sp. NGMCC 1.201702 TaxID=3391825 RepID=UPI0039F0C51F
MRPPRKADRSRQRDSDDEIVSLIPALRAFARTFCHEVSDADDLVQETLTKGLAAIDQFSPGTSLKSWLFTIMRNTFYTRIKSYMREAPGRIDCISGKPVMMASQEWSIRALELKHAIQRLPQQQREVLVLIGVLGTSYEDTAGICGCAVGTVKSRLSRARLRLLDELGEKSLQTLFETSVVSTAPATHSASRR